VAIQLGQKPGPMFPIWTPNDERLDWLLAKFWYRHAEFHVTQLVSHLSYTHFIFEPFAVALHHFLPHAHPVHKLLKEHLRQIIAINTNTNFIPGGSVDFIMSVGQGSGGIIELVAKAYKNFTYDDLDYVHDLIDRDVFDLPNYHHRDDAIKLWDATYDYIKEMVDLFYLTDADVIEDWELQAWVKDVFTNGFGKMKDLSKPSLGFPSSLSNKDDLKIYLHKIVYTGTARHSFASMYTFEYVKFIPNMPVLMLGSLPTEADRGKVTLEKVLGSLPPLAHAYQMNVIGEILAHHYADEVCLNETPTWMFVGKDTFERFQKKLDKIEEEIVERNKLLDIPYTVLQPSKITSGIST